MKQMMLAVAIAVAVPAVAQAADKATGKTAAAAGAAHYDVDPVHSEVGFTIKHMMVSNVHGQFRKYTADVTLDDKNPANDKINVDIDVSTIDTGNEKRDGHLKSPDFFDAAKFPKITFVSKKVTKAGKGLKVVGDLTMHGVTKEATLEVGELTQSYVNPMDKKEHRGASATATINRKDWGLTWNAPLQQAGAVMVGDDVKLNIDVELVKSDAAAATGTEAAGGSSGSTGAAK